MKTSTRINILAAAGLLALAGGLLIQKVYAQTATPMPGSQVNDARLRTVSVTGRGLVYAAPDLAVAQLGVQTEEESAAAALSANSEQMNRLLQELRSTGVAAADIQTRRIQLYPRYGERPGQTGSWSLVGYTAYNVVEVRVRNLDRLGSMLDAAVTAGGNIFEGIRFEVGNQESLLEQAREQAMNDARLKAAHLAGLANAGLGEVLTIQEESRLPVLPFQDVMQAEVRTAEVPVEPGSQSIEVHVSVTWLLQ